VTVYIPAFEPQHDEGLALPLTNCNPASNAMLIDWYTYGAIDTSDVLLRQASGIRPDVGMNFAAVNAAIKKLYGARLGNLLFSEANGQGNRNWVWRQLTAHWDAGGGAVVCGFYKDLPAHYRRWSPRFEGGHAGYAQGLGPGKRRWFDPLAAGDASYDGEPITDAVLWQFIWTAGSSDAARNFVTASHGFTAPRAEPSRFTDVLPSDPFYASIERLAEAGLVSGYSNRDGTYRFEPKGTITRAESAALVDRLRQEYLKHTH
jgi:S-layer homology domain